MLLGQYLERLHELSLLDRNISYNEIPAPFLIDFKTFNFGATIYKNDNGEFCTSSGDYNAWYNKIIHKGFDSQIFLNKGATIVD